MKLRQLECLCTVVDAEFNISRAAVLLNASQPAVSKQLKALEDELGLDLLLRYGGRAVGLTDVGERTVAWARQALQSVGNIRSLTQETHQDAQASITLVSSHTHAMYVLMPAIERFRRQHPRVRIVVGHRWSHDVFERVREGKAAAGVVTLGSQGLPHDVVAAPFLSWPLQVVAPAGHPVLAVEPLTPAALAAFPLVLSHASPLSEEVQRCLTAAGAAYRLSMESVDSDMTLECVRAGCGVGVIPAFVRDPVRLAGLGVRDAGALFRPVTSCVVLRRSSHLPQIVYDLLGQIDPSLDRRRLEALIFEPAARPDAAQRG